MQCYSPITISIDHTLPFWNVEKKRFSLDVKPRQFMYVPCGKCLACQAMRAREWSMRIWHEALDYNDGDNGMFITFTYDREHVPKDYSLHVRDIQLFYKRLRRRLEKYNKKIKHFTCGEYGKKKGRPHYHSILFGLSWRDEGAKQLIRECWTNGFVYFGYVSHASSQYVCKYMLKDFNYLSRKDYFRITGRERPFRIMSKGIGKKYALKYCENIASNLKIHFEGVDLSVPRSYLRWIEKNTPLSNQVRLKIKEKNRERVEKIFKELKEKYDITIRDKRSFDYEDDYYNIANHLELKEYYEDLLETKERQYMIRHDRFLEKLNNRYVDDSVA